MNWQVEHVYLGKTVKSNDTLKYCPPVSLSVTYRGIFDQENEVETILGRYISTEVSKTQILINNGNGIIPFIIDNEKLLNPFSILKIDSLFNVSKQNNNLFSLTSHFASKGKVYLSKISYNFVGLVVCNQDL